MGGVLNNVETGDTYPSSIEVQFRPPTAKVTLVIANAAVMVQWQRTRHDGQPEVGVWIEERFMVPGVYSMTYPAEGGMASGFRARSRVAGKPALVTVSPS